VIPPVFLVSALVFAAAVLGIWWAREQRMAAQRRRIRVLNTLGEEVFTSANPADLLRKLMDKVEYRRTGERNELSFGIRIAE